MPRERIERAQADADFIDMRGDRARVSDGVALEVAVVEPHRLDSHSAGPFGPPDRIRHLAARGKTESDAAGERHQARTPARRSCAISIRCRLFSLPRTWSDS